MKETTVDKRDHKEYNKSKSIRPYSPNIYRKYREKRPRKINYCQLIGCGRELPRFGILKHRKFCSVEHSTLYQSSYRKEWRKRNQEKVIAARKRYNDKKERERNDVTKQSKSHETRKHKTYII